MDRDGEHFMRDEYCYFDGKVKRCRNFVTLTASTYHPILKRHIPLVVMEAERENSENTELFWRLFVEAQREVAGNKDTDMAGANMNGLRRVFWRKFCSELGAVNFILNKTRTK